LFNEGLDAVFLLELEGGLGFDGTCFFLFLHLHLGLFRVDVVESVVLLDVDLQIDWPEVLQKAHAGLESGQIILILSIQPPVPAEISNVRDIRCQLLRLGLYQDIDQD